MISTLRARDPVLFSAGALMLLTLMVVVPISIGDTRVILGIDPWIKPAKFLISITIFLWTVAWFMPETRPAPGPKARVRWTITIAMTIEIALILLQSARGTTSHFNTATSFDAVVFNIMGITITISTIAMMRFLWLLRGETPPNRAGYLWGVRLGVAVFILASWQGFVIVANNAHSVPGPDGGPGLPFVNWSTGAGDLRIAHFFGMHALQALPILGFLLDRAGARRARDLVIVAGVVWIAVMGGLLVLALQGRPLLALP